jgi:hypothetical protein
MQVKLSNLEKNAQRDIEGEIGGTASRGIAAVVTKR